LAVLIGSAVCSMGGVAITAFISNADAAPAVVNLPFLASQFVSGVFFPFQDIPAALRYVGDVFPLRWLVESVRAGYLGFDYVHTKLVSFTRVTSSNGLTFRRSIVSRPAPVAVHGLHAITALWPAYVALLGWFVVFTVVAVRRFRWEPRSD
jgi:ABC-type multidrug transport system permease subunit